MDCQNVWSTIELPIATLDGVLQLGRVALEVAGAIAELEIAQKKLKGALEKHAYLNDLIGEDPDERRSNVSFD